MSAAPDPNVVAWAWDGIVQTNIPADLTNATKVAEGYAHSVALRPDGTVIAWGDNSVGQTNVPFGLGNVVAVAAGGLHSLALRFDGTVVAWGTNYFGEGTVPLGLESVVGIAAGFYHNLALKIDGTVVAWGTNYFGESTVPPGLNNVVAVAAGDDHSLALRTDGTVVSWGGYLGDEYWYPMVTPAGLSNVVAIAAGSSHCLALKADGTLVAWGDSRFGQTSIPAGLSNVISIAAGQSHSLALRTDGTVAGFGLYQGVPASLSNVVAIADGCYSSAIIGSGQPALGPPLAHRAIAQRAGTAIFYAPAVGAWPLTYQWQGNGTNLPNATNAWLVLTTPPAIDAALYSVVVSNQCGVTVTQEGYLNVRPAVFLQPPLDQVGYLGGTATFSMEVQASSPMSFQWLFNGTDLPSETNSTLTVSNLSRSSQGSYSVVVSNRFGSEISSESRLSIVNVAGWGNNSWSPFNVRLSLFGGQAVAPASLSNAVAISAGEAHSLALRSDGTVVAWGNNLEGETNVPPGLSNVVAIAAGPRHNLALRQDSTVVAWGWRGQAQVPDGLSNVVAIAAGGNHNVALRSDGTVFAWGGNDYGQTDIPAGLSNVVAIAAGDAHSLALRADGTLAAWGEYQHFDPSSYLYQMLPMEVPVLNWPYAAVPFTWMGSGASHCLAVLAGGVASPIVWAWGENRFGQANALSVTDAVAVDGGDQHSLLLRANGALIAWGDNSVGQTNIPADLHSVIAITAGGWHNLALIGVAPPRVSVQLFSPSLSNGAFSVSVPSQSGRVYSLQYKDSFGANLWRALPLVAGNGGIITLTDAHAARSESRYYRVLQW